MTDLTSTLLAWYDAHARELPWRGPSASPWSVLVSELMLQQTPVARVLPEQNLLLVRGAVPGAPGALVMVRKSVKTTKAQQRAADKR